MAGSGHEPGGRAARAQHRPGAGEAVRAEHPSGADRLVRAEGALQVVIMLAIGAAAGAASFTHVRNAAVAHGQPEWIGWADAVVLELMSVASGLELRRRKRHGSPARVPAAILCTAVCLSLAAQVVEAESSPIGWIAAVLPAAGFLAMVKLALGRSGPAASPGTGPGPDAAAGTGPGPQETAGPAVPDQDRRSGTGPPGARRQDDGPDVSAGSVLAIAAATAAATLAADGKPLTRKTLAAALRRDGHALSNATASRLLTTVRTPGARRAAGHASAARPPPSTKEEQH